MKANFDSLLGTPQGRSCGLSGTGISSTFPIGGLKSFPSLGYYHATKYAVDGLSEALFKEVNPLGIKVTIVAPGNFRTDWPGARA